MTRTLFKLAALAALGAALSGCVIYVSPDKTSVHGLHHSSYTSHEDDKPAPDEKPAATMDTSASSTSSSN